MIVVRRNTADEMVSYNIIDDRNNRAAALAPFGFLGFDDVRGWGDRENALRRRCRVVKFTVDRVRMRVAYILSRARVAVATTGRCGGGASNSVRFRPPPVCASAALNGAMTGRGWWARDEGRCRTCCRKNVFPPPPLLRPGAELKRPDDTCI